MMNDGFDEFYKRLLAMDEAELDEAVSKMVGMFIERTEEIEHQKKEQKQELKLRIKKERVM